jgi:hypothetical protein
LTADDLLRPPASHLHTPEDELSWFAGFLEGEGRFTLTKTGWRGYPVLYVQMASLDVIERARSMLGATSVRRNQPSDASWSMTYSVAISGAPAAAWMQRLRPLMGERRRAAIDAALEAYYPERLPVAPEHCVVPGCMQPHRGRGLCHKHYMSWLRDVAKGRVPRVKPLRSN